MRSSRLVAVASGCALLALIGVILRYSQDPYLDFVVPGDRDALLAEVEPSPDGRWVALSLDRERVAGNQTLYLVAVEQPTYRCLGQGRLAPLAWDDQGLLRIIERSGSRDEVRWIAPAQLDVVRVAQAVRWREQGLARPPAGQWAEQAFVRHPETGQVDWRVEWKERGRTLEMPGGQMLDVEVTEVPGVVYQLTRRDGIACLLRHDMATEAPPTELRCSPTIAFFDAAHDGQRVVVAERRDDTWTYEVLDGAGGGRVAGPWSGPRSSTSWLRQGGGRYLVLEREQGCELVDIDGGRVIPLGTDIGLGADVRVLGEQRFLVRQAATVDVLDARGALVRRLFPPAR